MLSYQLVTNKQVDIATLLVRRLDFDIKAQYLKEQH